MEGLSLKLGFLYQKVNHLEQKVKSSNEEILNLKTRIEKRDSELKLISEWLTSKLGYPEELNFQMRLDEMSQNVPLIQDLVNDNSNESDEPAIINIDFEKLETQIQENDVQIIFSNVEYLQATLETSDGQKEDPTCDTQTQKINSLEIIAHSEFQSNESPLQELGENSNKCLNLKKLRTNEESLIETKVTQCDLCGKLLKDYSSLKQHSIVHCDIRPFSCSVCSKTFRRKFHLKTHQLVHSRERKFMCNYCGKLFLLKKDVNNHEKIHLDEKLFWCQLCPKRFNLKSHLVIHQRTHTGEKPYQCEICDKTFSQSNSLRVHKKIHFRLANLVEGTK